MAFQAALTEQDVLSHAVPSCPGWTVGELTRHLGGFYHRIRLHAGVGGADDRWPPLAVPDEAPAADDPAVVTWFGEQLAGILAQLESLDADTPTYNWAPRPRVAAFWHRRAAHETAVHRWDAQVATKLPEPIESKLAGDTVAECLDTFLPAGRRQPTDMHGLVHLAATDLGQNWYVRLRGDNVSLLDTDDTLDALATATGSASDLALALWGRVPFDVLEISGDPALFEAIRIR
jgi:uncharacterized protein (TIGR03083 family)